MECKYHINFNISNNSISYYRLGAQKPNQTFFMADRMRKQGGSNAAGNRPLSIDEMNTTHHGVMLQSTNDSRIHEMLPHVNGQV